MKPFIQKSFIDLHECDIISQYVDLLDRNNRLSKVIKKNGQYWQLNGDPLTDAVGLVYLPKIESILDKNLSLTYTMLRRWKKDCFIDWHRNKWECEVTVVLQISDNHWSIAFASNNQSGSNPVINGTQDEQAQILTPQQGDAGIYNAAETHHGRRPLKDTACTTLMLYYVEKNSYLDQKDNRQVYGDNYQSRLRPNGDVWKINA